MMETLASSHKVQRMCQAFKVSRSGYYKYLHQEKEGKRNKENAIVLLEMMNIWLQSRRVYGSPRLKAALTNMGYKVNKKRVVRLMQIDDIKKPSGRRNIALQPTLSIISLLWRIC